MRAPRIYIPLLFSLLSCLWEGFSNSIPDSESLGEFLGGKVSYRRKETVKVTFKTHNVSVVTGRCRVVRLTLTWEEISYESVM